MLSGMLSMIYPHSLSHPESHQSLHLTCTVSTSHLYCLYTSPVLSLHLTCTVYTSHLYCLCISPVLSLHLTCTVSAPHLYCLYTSPVLSLHLTCTVSTSHLHCLCISPVLSYISPVLSYISPVLSPTPSLQQRSSVAVPPSVSDVSAPGVVAVMSHASSLVP